MFKIYLFVLTAVLIVAYIVWEAYWYTLVNLAFIKWHTHLVFAFLISFLIWLPFFVFYKINNKGKDVLLMASSIAILLFVIEVFFVVFPFKKTYLEKITGHYQSPFIPGNNYFHVWDKMESYWLETPEYKFFRKANSLGFADKEWSLKKTNDKIRMVTLGDSFTEGDGAPYDSIYPRLLQNILGEKYEVLNGGVCASDPVFNYWNLEKRLLAYRPDIVVQTISDNDVLYDFSYRGGFERFVNDSVLKYKPSPAWEPIYALSYTSRLIFDALETNPHNLFYQNNNHLAAETEEKRLILHDCLNRYETLAAQNNFTVLIILLPWKSNIEQKKYAFDFAKTKELIATLPHLNAMDLMLCYNAAMGDSVKLIEKYYWKKDVHHNSEGYALMARCIAESLLEK